MPEDGYHGDYVAELAGDIVARARGRRSPICRPRSARSGCAPRARGGRWTGSARPSSGSASRSTRYVSEASLAAQGRDRARRSSGCARPGYVYEADGAVWFRSTAFGDDKDRVVDPLERDGTRTSPPTSPTSIDKFRRGFDHLIYVWGADHHGDVARVKGAATALGFDPDRGRARCIYQFVSFLRGGEPVQMSKRAGTFVSLDELIDEVGTDAARFHLLLFSNDHTMNFDIEEVARQSMENPVYYVQYGHARIASILRKAEAAGVTLAPVEDARSGAPGARAPSTDLLRALADVPG